MSIRNYEQVRAREALKFWNNQANRANTQGDNDGDVVRGLGALIINGGLLSTIAFAKDKGKGYETFMKEIGRFLSIPEIKVLKNNISCLDDFIKSLTDENSDSTLLQQATTESLAYLAYLKRFRIKENHAEE